MHRFLLVLTLLATVSGCTTIQTTEGPKPQIQTRTKYVALSFDDGPSQHTATLLNILKAEGVKATFYVVGNRVKSNSNLITRMAREGHELGNHTWSHPNLTKLGDAAIRRQIQSSTAAIQAVIKGYRIQTFRPPFGAYNSRVLKAVGLRLAMWDIDTRDWQRPGVGKIVERASRAKSGDIILFHDTHGASVQAVPAIIKNLKARGFRFVRVKDLR